MSGTISRGILAPIVSPGDDIVKIAVDSVLAAAERDGFAIQDRDVLCVTETVVARADNNFATVDQIAEDVRAKFPGGTVGVVFPITSRNRFAIVLRGIARGAKKVVVQLSYPTDEVGNHLVPLELLEESGVNPWTDVLSVADFRKHFGTPLHPFTQMDYLTYYTDLIREEGAEAELILANDPTSILAYTSEVLAADIHTRERTKARLIKGGAKRAYTMCDLLSAPVSGSGCNPQYGLLGCNKSNEGKVKLFPKNAPEVARKIQALMLERTGKHIEAMVYGDGAFKDPVGKIWELADPVVSPGFTDGLVGLPNELKLKYLADNEFAGLSGEELKAAIRERISQKGTDLMGTMAAQGTTPRRLTDLIGSLCDLTSGSGDKGTPIVYIQNYFSNYSEQ